VQADAPTDVRVLHFAEFEAFGPRAGGGATAASGSPVGRAVGSGNFANEYSISLENDSPVTVEYLMSYNPGLHFYVNGRQTDPAYGPGTLAKFELSPGRNRVEVRYRNVMLSLFWVLYGAYAAVVAVVLGKLTWTRLTSSPIDEGVSSAGP